MYEYPFPMVSCAATMVVADVKKGLVLLGKRSANSDAYPDMWSLPGGFLDAGKETPQQTAVRELKEETGLIFKEEDAFLYGIDGTPGIDPRAHVINVLYIFASDEETMKSAKPNDDLQELKVVSLVEALAIPMAFNHNALLERAAEYMG